MVGRKRPKLNKTCEHCTHWKQFNETSGFCDNPDSYLDETMYHSECDLWKIKQ